ncbi:MAG: phage virion morphogenesis protein [Gammaproteobacteria bacterium]
MAGSFISIDFDDRDVADFLRQLLEASVRLKPAFDEMGVELSERWGEPRFLSQAGPDGTPWAPNSPDYLESKKAETGRDLILVLERHLMESITHQASDHDVRIGTNRVYGATHQFGAAKGSFGTDKRGRPIPWGDIPARPYLGVSEADKEEIFEVLREHLERSLRRP